MVKTFQIVFCIFLTSGFAGMVQSAKADYCFENANKSGVMAPSICFKEIKVLKPGSPDSKIYIRNRDVDDIFSVKKWSRSPAGYTATIQGDYLNYSENCGLTIFSQFEFALTMDTQYQYVHDPLNSLIIKYRYSPNNCKIKWVNGIERFSPLK